MILALLALLAQANFNARLTGVSVSSPSISMANFFCPSDIVVSGATLVCTVTLTAPAPFDGFQIGFTTDNPAVTVSPSPFPIGAMSDTVLFSVAPGTPSGTFAIKGQMAIRIAALPTTFVSSLVCDQTALAPGATSNCNVNLNQPATGFGVPLAAQTPLSLSPASLTITSTGQVQVTRSMDNTILQVASIVVGNMSWTFTFPDQIPPIPPPVPFTPLYEPAYPLLQDTTAATKQILQLVAPCGSDNAACASGMAAICAMTIPSNCSVSCGPGGYVSCNAPVIQDAAGVWSSRNR